jgi:hypothetical protein
MRAKLAPSGSTGASASRNKVAARSSIDTPPGKRSRQRDEGLPG